MFNEQLKKDKFLKKRQERLQLMYLTGSSS